MIPKGFSVESKKNKKGRPSSGKTHAEIDRESRQRRREEMKAEGFVTRSYVVKKETADRILALKKERVLQSAGEVLDEVFSDENNV